MSNIWWEKGLNWHNHFWLKVVEEPTRVLEIADLLFTTDLHCLAVSPFPFSRFPIFPYPIPFPSSSSLSMMAAGSRQGKVDWLHQKAIFHLFYNMPDPSAYPGHPHMATLTRQTHRHSYSHSHWHNHSRMTSTCVFAMRVCLAFHKLANRLSRLTRSCKPLSCHFLLLLLAAVSSHCYFSACALFQIEITIGTLHNRCPYTGKNEVSSERRIYRHFPIILCGKEVDIKL